MNRSGNRGRGSNGRSPLEKLIGHSEVMRGVRDRIQRISASHVPILIHGETGTGKELCAEAIAAESAASPFIAVNCAAFAEGVIDSELFGHERGAFTGADRAHTGIVAAAHGGILFLDELAEVSAPVQAKLLRALESGEYRPVGSASSRRSTFRIIAATSGNVDELVEAGKLRPDLLHRLGALRILLPPLRDRLQDLPPLAEEFLTRYRLRSPGGPAAIGEDAIRVLLKQPWPGNVRQLRNVVEAAAAVAPGGGEIHARHVIEVLSEGRAPSGLSSDFPTLAEALDETERRILVEALGRTDQNRERAARLLGISEATLYRKLAKHLNGTIGAIKAAKDGASELA